MQKTILAIILTATICISGTYLLLNKSNDTVYLSNEDTTSFDENEKQETVSREEIAEDTESAVTPNIEQDIDQTLATKQDLGINNQDIEVIKEYYAKIAHKDELQEAYNMKIDPSVSYSTFEEWYKGWQAITPSKFIRTGENRYEFQVSFLYFDEDVNERYYVIMDVIDNKLKTISSIKITSKQIDESARYNQNLIANIGWNNGAKFVELIKNGKTIKIEGAETPTGIGIFQSFSNPRFVADGQYLMYDVGEWEYQGYSVYDVQKEKIVFSAAGRNGNFTADNKFFYDCSESGLASGAVQVLTVPSFNTIYNANTYIDKCLYFDPSSGNFAFTSVDFDNNQEFQVSKNVYQL